MSVVARTAPDVTAHTYMAAVPAWQCAPSAAVVGKGAACPTPTTDDNPPASSGHSGGVLTPARNAGGSTSLTSEAGG